MRQLLSLIGGFIIFLGAAGCEKKCSQYNYCSIGLSSYGSPSIIGYYAHDVDTQIVLTYYPNGLFNQRRDSFCYINTDVTGGYVYNESDTQYLSLRFSGGTFNSQQVNDMKLILPGVRTYTFTEVMVDGEFGEEDEFRCSQGSSGCYRRVTSMKIDGIYHDFSSDSTRLVLYK